MKLNKVYLNKIARGAIVLALLVSVIGFSERNPDADECREVIIRVENQAENYFLAEDDIMNIISNNGIDRIAGASFGELNLKEMEDRVKEEAFVDDVELYRDLKANLHVKVSLKRPMARIIRNDGPHAYIAEDRTLMPVSDKYAARVVLVSGDVRDQLLAPDAGNTGFIDLVEKIYNDPFWSGQIAQLHLKKNGEVLMYPQVTRQTIEFGLPEDADAKFRKLKIFYKDILPSKGWNTYSRVNVAFKDQIIAE